MLRVDSPCGHAVNEISKLAVLLKKTCKSSNHWFGKKFLGAGLKFTVELKNKLQQFFN